MNEIVPRRTLTKQGVTAIGGLAGGIALLVLSSLPSVFGIVAGVIVTLAGLATTSSKESSGKRTGLLVTAAGALTILSKIGVFAGFASPLLGLATIGLIGMGVWNGIKFIKGIRSRA